MAARPLRRRLLCRICMYADLALLLLRASCCYSVHSFCCCLLLLRGCPGGLKHSSDAKVRQRRRGGNGGLCLRRLPAPQPCRAEASGRLCHTACGGTPGHGSGAGGWGAMQAAQAAHRLGAGRAAELVAPPVGQRGIHRKRLLIVRCSTAWQFWVAGSAKGDLRMPLASLSCANH